MREFKDFSGLQINLGKSELMKLNYQSEIVSEIPVVNQVKVTGIWFSSNEQNMTRLNWDAVKAKITGKLNNWKGRHLSEIGRTHIIKSQIIPIILYTAKIIRMPPETEKYLTKLLYRFIGNGSEKEMRALLCQKRAWRSRSTKCESKSEKCESTLGE